MGEVSASGSYRDTGGESQEMWKDVEGSGLRMATGVGTARTVVFEGSCVASAAAPLAMGVLGHETAFSPNRRCHRKPAMLSPISINAGFDSTVVGNDGSECAMMSAHPGTAL
eukprot:6290663-Prymnesium_polylepis.1